MAAEVVASVASAWRRRERKFEALFPRPEHSRSLIILLAAPERTKGFEAWGQVGREIARLEVI